MNPTPYQGSCLRIINLQNSLLQTEQLRVSINTLSFQYNRSTRISFLQFYTGAEKVNNKQIQ